MDIRKGPYFIIDIHTHNMSLHRLSSSFYVTLPSSDNLSVYPDNTLSSFYNELPQTIDFHDRKFVVGLSEFILEGNAATEISDHASSAAYMYTNITEPQIVGSNLLRLIRIFPILKQWTLFEKPHYVPVESNFISRIRIDIRDVSGQRFPFADGHAIVKLHFKETNDSI